MDKRKIRGVQLNDAHSIHYFQMSDGELSMTVDCVHGNCIITEKELLSYLQTRNSLKTAERNDSGGVAGGQGTANTPNSAIALWKLKSMLQEALFKVDGLTTSQCDSIIHEMEKIAQRH